MSKLLDVFSEYLSRRKGLLPLIGMLFIAINLGLQFIAPESWLAARNIFLHFGLIIAIIGLMLAWAL